MVFFKKEEPEEGEGSSVRKSKLKSRPQSKIAWEAPRRVLPLLQCSAADRVPTFPRTPSLSSFPMNWRLYSPVCTSLLRLECMAHVWFYLTLDLPHSLSLSLRC